MDVMIDFNNKCEREEIHELLKEAIKEAGEQIKVECPTGTLKALEKLIETQEKIIEDQEERIAIMTEGGWHDASKRPPKEGRYLVWGLHEFTPDHCDMPNAYWQTRIAQWLNITGWDTKVKYWQELPEPPKEGEAE